MSGGDDEDTEKEHEPSQKKLEDARKKGEIARSNDLTTAASYAGLLLVLVGFGVSSLQAFGSSMMTTLDQAESLSEMVFNGSGSTFSGGLIMETIKSLSPWFTIPGLLALLSVLAQKGFVVAPSKLAPKLNRISPIASAKNKFGRSGLFEFFKSFTKLLIYSTILGFFLMAQLPKVLSTMHLSPNMVMTVLGQLGVKFISIVFVVALALGAIDFLWQKAEHTRKNRMSRKEVMDEHKNNDGDPHMKQQRRQRGFEIAMNQMLADVPEADVVIVNPTHYAVALKWSRTTGAAPTCVAKGVDEIAARIREKAMEAGVPIHSDPPTARALFATVEVGQQIAPDHYRTVAAAIRFADRMRKKMQESGFGRR